MPSRDWSAADAARASFCTLTPDCTLLEDQLMSTTTTYGVDGMTCGQGGLSWPPAFQ